MKRLDAIKVLKAIIEVNDSSFVLKDVQLSVLHKCMSQMFTSTSFNVQEFLSTGELEILWEIKFALEGVINDK